MALVVDGSFDALDTVDGRIWRRHLERSARTAGVRLVEPERWAMRRSRVLGTVAPERVRAFARVERMLVAAQREVAALREHRALAILAGAERIVADHADVPGSAGWIAEVQTAIGITAALVGQQDLVEVAFTRAALMDSSRGVRAAEATDEVAALAETIARRVATRPVGSFEVTVAAPDARVFLDDVEIGVAPQLVRAPIGSHVLRVEAPGHRPWGRIVHVLEGRRAPMAIHPSPDPLLVAARRLAVGVAEEDAEGIASSVAALNLAGVWIVEIGAGEQARALLSVCEPQGCRPTRRLEIDEVPIVVPRHADTVEAVAWRSAKPGHRGWLAAAAPYVPPAPPPPWYRRWWVWAIAGVVLVSGAITFGVIYERPTRQVERPVGVVCSPLDPPACP